MLAIDGLEESGQPTRWAELLGELASELARHPRIRVAVSLRTSAREILTKTRKSAFVELPLPEDGEVQGLVQTYCDHYRIPRPERRLRWAIRDPLSLRLFCELSRDGGWSPSRKNVALPNLFKAKLLRVEAAVCEQEGIGLEERPLQTLLGIIAKTYVNASPPRYDEAIEAARASVKDRVSSASWSRIFERAKNEGLLLTTEPPESESLLERPAIHVEPANEPLLDYLLAAAAQAEIRKVLPAGGAAAVLQRLAPRPDAITQVAVLLAGEGVDLRRPDLWPPAWGPEQIETSVLRAIASMDDGAANAYREWVRERLVGSLPSCRRVLAELCIPVARDEAHPLGPLFVHEALLPFKPAKRDLFWSGPPDLVGEGEPWAGPGVEALERVKLVEDDTAEGPPLLLGWALTSVDNRWRRRLRAELARWGAKRIDELIRWLELVFQTNDPQMAEDAAMVAFGAACLAGTDARLAQLSAWVDVNLLAPDAPRRREDIVVLHAARGVVERANVMGVPVPAEMLEHARKLYSTKDELLEMDAEAAREADDRWGITPITGDLAWYVVPGAIRPFFPRIDSWGKTLDPRAERLLEAHAERAGLDSLSPQKFAFGALAAQLHAIGWNEALAEMSAAIASRHEQETHGARSPVTAVDEKYVWTGCHALQAYLAGRVPIQDYAGAGTLELFEPPVDPVLVARLPPNPVSDMSLVATSVDDDWTSWPDDGLTPRLDLDATEQLKRAVEWVQRAPEPNLCPWLILSGSAGPERADDSEWLMLYCSVNAREGDSQGESILRVSSASVEEGDAERLRSGGGFRRAYRRGSHPRELSEFGESIQCSIYADPSEVVWAPWARALYGVERVEPEEDFDDSATIELLATKAGLTWEADGGESNAWLPAHWLRSALGIVDVERRGTQGREWRFKDRAGNVHAIHVQGYWDDRRLEALVIRRASLEQALAGTGRTIVWPIWLFRNPRPSLIGRDHRFDFPWARRHSEFVAFMQHEGVDVRLFHTEIEIHEDERPQEPEPPTPKPASSVVQVGPTNPDLAVPLASELDDDDATPYFLWDDPMTVAEFRRRLREASAPERDRLLGLLLREARDPDVWRFTTPEEVDARFDSIAKHLGRRKAFWVFLLDAWRKEGLLGQKSA
ncbi:hypothetical protein [Polyangium spumosum]|uniref:Uncharacterized protein n=1 Tax=Polyangium spumosum TaxID=889282 RepID=A0A6N7PNR9_9BACT|nr:hypothetical protein [Polyangium spumosum]MRG90551.1 hypothetical protein [Polyangium spumosum]